MEFNKLNSTTVQIFGYYDTINVSGFAMERHEPYHSDIKWWDYNFSYMMNNSLYKVSSNDNRAIRNLDLLYDHIISTIEKEVTNILAQKG